MNKMSLLMFALCALIGFASTAQAEDGAMQQAQTQMGRTWEKMTPEIEVDRQTFTRITGEKLEKIKDGIEHLKDSVFQQGIAISESDWNNTLKELTRKTDEAQNYYNELRATDDQNWGRLKGKVHDSIKDTDDKLIKAHEKFLPEKQAYEWKVQNKIDGAEFKIKKLESNLGAADEKEKMNIREDINKLRMKKEEASKLLDSVRKEKTDAWKEIKGPLDSVADDLD